MSSHSTATAFIRRFDPIRENYGGIWAQSRRNRVYAVVWTHGNHRIVRTKAEGARVMRVWKEWYRRQGWSVYGNIAKHPETGERHAVVLHEYDAESRGRV